AAADPIAGAAVVAVRGDVHLAAVLRVAVAVLEAGGAAVPSKSMRHTPSSQTPWAFAGAHTSPHPPQLLRSASVFTSQPSEARSLQSAVPEAHTNVQRPSSHSAAASSGGALQSPSSTQALPTSHPSQGPPQSTSISPPFFTRSVQLASAQVPLL